MNIKNSKAMYLFGLSLHLIFLFPGLQNIGELVKEEYPKIFKEAKSLNVEQILLSYGPLWATNFFHKSSDKISDTYNLNEPAKYALGGSLVGFYIGYYLKRKEKNAKDGI